MVDFYNSELAKGLTEHAVDRSHNHIKWSSSLRSCYSRRIALHFRADAPRISQYRPFTKNWLYFDSKLNHRIGKLLQIFPTDQSENEVIVLPGPGEDRPFSVFISNTIPDLHLLHGGQCFPRYLYGSTEVDEQPTLFPNGGHSVVRKAICDRGFARLVAAYHDCREVKNVSRDDVFYYVYGLLHSEDYRSRFADNLSKELPRIPAVKKFEDFQAFSQAGHDLAHWHLDYETVDCHPATIQLTDGSSAVVDKRGAKHDKLLKNLKDDQFYVHKMKFAKTKDPETGKSVNDRTTVIYNDFISVKNIPLEAYDYVVNGKSAIEWVIERQSVTTDKDSGIVNDANLWATETMNNAAYPLELLLRVINVSLETMKIVNNLPNLEIG